MTASNLADRALRSPATGLLLLLFVQAFFLHYWPTFHPANESIRFYFVESFVHEGTLSVDPALARYGLPNIDAATVDGRSYMDKAPGLAFAAVPLYALLDVVGATAALHWTAIWALLTLLAVTLPSLWATALLYRLLRDLSGRHDVALGLAAAWAVATPALVYSTLFFGHQLSAALLLAGFATLKPAEQAPITGRRAALAAFLLGWSVLTQYEVVLAASGVALFGVVRAGTTRRRLWLLAGGAVPAALMLVYHTLAFGGPFAFPYGFKAHGLFAQVHAQGVYGFGLPSLQRAADLLVGARRGLLYAAPFLALWPVGVIRLFDAPSWRHARWAVLWVGAAHTLLVLGYGYWTGGDAVGARFLVPAIPFLVLPLAALWRPARPRWEFPLAALRGGVLPGLVAVGVLHAALPVATFPYHPEPLEAPLLDLNVPLAVVGCTAPNVLGVEGNAALLLFLGLLAVSGGWLWYATHRPDTPRPAPVGHARLGHALTAAIAAVAVLAAQVIAAPPPERPAAVRIRANVKLLIDCGTVQRDRQPEEPPFQGGEPDGARGVGSWESGAAAKTREPEEHPARHR